MKQPATVRYSSPFASPVHMPRSRAERLREQDSALVHALREVGGGAGLFFPFLEG